MRIWGDPAELDRMNQDRHPQRLQALWQAGTSRVLPVDRRGVFPVCEPVGPDQWQSSGEVVLAVRPPAYRQPPTVRLAAAATQGSFDPERHWLLGRVDGAALFCEPQDEVDGVTLRETGALLPAEQAQAAAMAAALAAWHSGERYCPRCGEPTRPASGGLVRYCARCDRELFCRTDPAVIVAVTDSQDRLLLGHQRVWPQGRYSVLAGFVEAGESLEQAVHREVVEETGIQVEQVEYVGSQPWPFPRSLMLGFRARAVATTIAVDQDEIADARWFSREQVRAGAAAQTLLLPGESSIAFRLIDGWLTAAD
ncbi:MAG: NAD(+) diphosphatase [Actinomycetia bacterium]|nr:NAD(+) diphosphatase [Actinomycetes bacterium]